MQKQVLLPQVELTMESVTVLRWLVVEGDQVKAEQPLLEVETQKATVEVPSSADGFVRKLCVEVEEDIGERAVLCILTDTADEPFDEKAKVATAAKAEGSTTAPASTQAHSTPSPATAGGLVRAAPAARKKARDLDIDLGGVTGTGPGGRITAKDVEAAASESPPEVPSKETGEGWETLPPRRLALIQQMEQSLKSIPQIHVSRQIDVTALIADNEDGITFTHRLIRAVAAALARHPRLRTVLRENRVKTEPVSVAVAMDTEHGLVAPALRRADRLSTKEIARQIGELRRRADANRLKRDDLIHAPFALSNLGMFGVDQFGPFVFGGQTAVLGIGKAALGPNQTRTAWFTLATDHRLVDGAEAAKFLAAVQKKILEQ